MKLWNSILIEHSLDSHPSCYDPFYHQHHYSLIFFCIMSRYSLHSQLHILPWLSRKCSVGSARAEKFDIFAIPVAFLAMMPTPYVFFTISSRSRAEGEVWDIMQLVYGRINISLILALRRSHPSQDGRMDRFSIQYRAISNDKQFRIWVTTIASPLLLSIAKETPPKESGHDKFALRLISLTEFAKFSGIPCVDPPFCMIVCKSPE